MKKKLMKYLLSIFVILIALFCVLAFDVYRNVGGLPDEMAFEHLPYYKNGAFISPETLVFYPERTVGKSYRVGRSKNAPSFPLPVIPLIKEQFQQKSEFAYYWLGHSSAILELAQQRFLMDPVFDNAAPTFLSFIVQRYQNAPLNAKIYLKLMWY